MRICLQASISLLMFFLVVPQVHADFSTTVRTDEDSGVSIVLRSPLGSTPRQGVYPLTVEIKNFSARSRDWTVQLVAEGFGQESMSEVRELRVAPGRSERFNIYFDLIQSSKGYNLPNVTVNLAGYGVVGFSEQLPMRYSASQAIGTPFLAFTNSFHLLVSRLEREWQTGDPSKKKPGSTIKDYPELSALLSLGAKDVTFSGSEVSMDLLSPDWRGYLGIGQLWLTQNDWLALDSVVRSAIRAWLLQGGTLVVVSPAFDSVFLREFSIARNSETLDRSPYGLGTVVSLLGTEETVGPSEVSKVLVTSTAQTPLGIGEANQAPGGKSRAERSGVKASNSMSPIILLTVVIYAIAVGPFNVYVWSKKNRAMLYVTTPIISISAAALLFGLILLGDGTGGSGERFLLTMLMPGDRNMLLLQQQSASTGLLFDRQFELSEGAIIRPVPTANDSTYARGSGSLEKSGESYRGDWFRNRSMISHLLQSVISSRARVELLNDKASASPSVLSSIDASFSRFFYVDAGGRVWEAEQLTQGTPMRLAASTPQKLIEFLHAERGLVGPALEEVIDRVAERRGYFFAHSPQAEALALATLSSIRWTSTPGFFTGPISGAGV